MTTRLEGDPLDPHWRAIAGAASLITVDLSPLSPSDALSIARRFIGADAFVTQCVERAGGNPLFLEQLLRSAADLTDGRLPSSIQNVVLARTDLLSPEDRRAIQTASVLGQRFSLRHLRALLQEPHYACDTLVRNVLLRPVRDGLQFAHALVRDGVYGSLTHARRRELHKSAAAIFVDDPVLRAEHLDRAGDAEAPRAYLDGVQGSSSAVPDRSGHRAGDAGSRARSRTARHRRSGPASRGFAAGRRTRRGIARRLSTRAVGERRRGGPAARAARERGGQSTDGADRRRLFRPGRGGAVGGRRPSTIARWPRFIIFAATSISLAANCRNAAANTNARSRRRGGSIRRNGRPGR